MAGLIGFDAFLVPSRYSVAGWLADRSAAHVTAAPVFREHLARHGKRFSLPACLG